VDIDSWIIPLEVCWLVSAVGLVCATASPPPGAFLPAVSPTAGAMAIAGLIGLAVALVMVHYGLIQRSFLDAEDRPVTEPTPKPEPKEATKPRPAARNKAKGKKGAKGKGKGKGGSKSAAAPKPAKQAAPLSVSYGKEHGVSPRREVLREVVFLGPSIILAVAAWLLVTRVAPVRDAWLALCTQSSWSPHLHAAMASIFGYLVGGLWIWAFRIFGTLGFGREAMGLGDVHILAAVGAVCGWVVPSIAFFMAAFLALAWALTIFVSRKQRELPYGPWLAAGALVTVLFYDYLMVLLRPYREVFQAIAGN